MGASAPGAGLLHLVTGIYPKELCIDPVRVKGRRECHHCKGPDRDLCTLSCRIDGSVIISYGVPLPLQAAWFWCHVVFGCGGGLCCASPYFRQTGRVKGEGEELGARPPFTVLASQFCIAQQGESVIRAHLCRHNRTVRPATLFGIDGPDPDRPRVAQDKGRPSHPSFAKPIMAAAVMAAAPASSVEYTSMQCRRQPPVSACIYPTLWSRNWIACMSLSLRQRWQAGRLAGISRAYLVDSPWRRREKGPFVRCAACLEKETELGGGEATRCT